jgi:hypothetical protein
MELQEGNSDLTIIPIAVNIEFLSKKRSGPKYLYGQIEEWKFEFIDASL